MSSSDWVVAIGAATVLAVVALTFAALEPLWAARAAAAALECEAPR